MGIEGARLAETFMQGPGQRIEFIDGAGHFLHLEQPKVHNDLVMEFVQ
jgi:pimeloyl-ACP methyl ester carboxylesterase